jgi:RNA polymerase sigma-70 factor, ECF subfamily
MPDTRPDEALLDAFRAGDDGAFVELYARYRDRVTGYAWRITGRREDAEDVCVEAFAKVVDGAWRPVGSFRAFLFTVVHRLCLNQIRARGRQHRAYDRLLAEPLAPGVDPERATLMTDEQRQIDAALAGLPEDQRAAVLLFYGQDLSSRQVADILGFDDQQVRSKLSYARRLLRERLGADEGVS